MPGSRSRLNQTAYRQTAGAAALLQVRGDSLQVFFMHEFASIA